MELIACGRTAEVLKLDNDHVLKLFRQGIPGNFIEEEYKISTSLKKNGIRVPEAVEIVEVNGRKGIIYQNVRGVTMLKAISMKPWIINREATRLALMHCRIHSNCADGLVKQKVILKQRIQQAPLLTSEEKAYIISYLEGLDEKMNLCHGDFHPDNIILAENAWTIDWTSGMSGNPAGDVARTILILRFGEVPKKIPKVIVALFAALRKRMLIKYIDKYLQHSTVSKTEIDKWLMPVAAARLTEWVSETEKQNLLSLVRKQIQSGESNNFLRSFSA